MYKYYPFNADKFLKDSRKWGKELDRLRRELDAITELKAIENSEIHTASISDPTFSTAQKRLEIEQEIERLELYQDIYNNAMSSISPEQKEVLDSFYQHRNLINKNVDDLANKYNCSTRMIYKMRDGALKAFAACVDSLVR